jgi:hypothetical protein
MKRSKDPLSAMFDRVAERKETWKDIQGYEGLYQVSDLGKVKSTKFGRVKILKLKKDKRGYYRARLWKDNVLKTYSTARLVATNFIPNPENKATVNHIDGIKTNNCVTNLEWNTSSENQLHAYKTGLRFPYDHKGEAHPNAKLDNEKVECIRFLWNTGRISKTAIAKIYKVSPRNIYGVINRRLWNHVT